MLKNDIVNLRNSGNTYSQIQSKLNCSKSTVSYYLGKGQKEKTRLRTQKRRYLHPFVSKLEAFRDTSIIKKKKKGIYLTEKLLYLKIGTFHGNKKGGFSMKNINFTVKDVLDKVGENPICYLTGDSIDISQPRTYNFDHIIPRSKGGSNELDNLGVCTKVANSSKTDMTKDEYIEHCKKVLLHNGYRIEKEQT